MSFIRRAITTLTAAAAVAHANSVNAHGSSWAPDHILRVSTGNITLSCESRYSVLVNGTHPGPLLRIPEGKTTWIRVYNDVADQNVTMHWHGLALYTAPFSDGSPAVSQWPIPPNHFFDYELYPEPGAAGSYFYHSHIGMQANTALGPLIIDDAEKPPFNYYEDRVITFSDYWNRTDKDIEKGLVASPFVWEGEVNNVLVNGENRYVNSTLPAGPKCQLHTIRVEPEKTYRLRFISGAMLSFLVVALESHKLWIIKADGAYTKPLPVDHFQIGSGQRYDVLLHTKSRAELSALNKSSYYLQFDTRDRPVNLTSYAVLSYSDAPAPLPPSKPAIALPNTEIGWKDFDLIPLNASTDFPTKADRQVVLSVYQNSTFNSTPTTGPANVWSVFDEIPWYPELPRKPLLVALYENDRSVLPDYNRAIAHGGFDPQVKAFAGKMGEVIDIVLEARGQNHVGDIHPFHLHGAHFWDLGSGVGPYNATAHEALMDKARKEKGWTPLKRDSSMLYRGNATSDTVSNYRLWRVKVTDPGVWMLHCHTLAHMIMGMQSVWLLGDVGDVPPLPAGFAQSYLVFGGSAYGNSKRAPKVVEWSRR